MSAAATVSAGRLPALDAVRAIGSIGVLIYHVAFNTGISLHGTWNGLLARLDVGVAVFFVLSGFLLFRPFAHAAATGSNRPSAMRYLWRRALRILPAYWVTVAVCLVVLPQNFPAPAPDWIHHLTLTQIYGPALIRNGLTQTWSLATEVAFYLILPLVALAAVGRRWRPARALAVSMSGIAITGAWIVAMQLGHIGTQLHTMWLPSYAIWFGGGMALATCHVALATGTAPRGWRLLDDIAEAPFACWALALGLLAIASTPLAGPRELAEPTPAEFATKLALYAVIAVLVVLPVGFGRHNQVKSVLSGELARWLGAISYGVFLWHPLIIELVLLARGWGGMKGDPLGTLAITLVGALVLGSLSYYAIERPIQRWGARWPARRRRTATESHMAVAPVSAAS